MVPLYCAPFKYVANYLMALPFSFLRQHDSSEQVDVISDSEKLVMDGSDPKSDPRVATYTTNINSSTHTTNGISTQK